MVRQREDQRPKPIDWLLITVWGPLHASHHAVSRGMHGKSGYETTSACEGRAIRIEAAQGPGHQGS